MTYEHWNNPGMLPPVGCPLVIRVGQRPGPAIILKVERTRHLVDRNGQMEYRSLRVPGAVYHGRFEWTYP